MDANPPLVVAQPRAGGTNNLRQGPGNSTLPRGRRLSNVENVKRALAHCYREIEAGRLPVDKGRAMIAACVAIAGLLQGSEADARMREIEGALGLARR